MTPTATGCSSVPRPPQACEQYGAELRRRQLQVAMQVATRVAPSRGSAATTTKSGAAGLAWGSAGGLSRRGTVRAPRSAESSGEERYQDFKRFLDLYITSRGAADGAASVAPEEGRERASLGSASMPTVAPAACS
jgi:hypothetical protein